MIVMAGTLDNAVTDEIIVEWQFVEGTGSLVCWGRTRRKVPRDTGTIEIDAALTFHSRPEEGHTSWPFEYRSQSSRITCKYKEKNRYKPVFPSSEKGKWLDGEHQRGAHSRRV